MVGVKKIYERVLTNYISVARDHLGVPVPYQIELGAIGLKGMRVSLPSQLRQWPNQFSEPIYEDQLRLRRALSDSGADAQHALIEEFLRKLYDLAAVRISEA
jgi:hypothetical protein